MTDLSGLLSRWGYAAVLLGVVLGNLGVPVSEDVLFLLTGYLTRQDRFSLPGVVIIGIVATVTGEKLGYWIGRRLGQPAVTRYARWGRLSPARVAQLQRLVIRHGPVAVFLARVVSGARFLAGPLAGSMGLHPLVFVGAKSEQLPPGRR